MRVVHIQRAWITLLVMLVFGIYSMKSSASHSTNKIQRRGLNFVKSEIYFIISRDIMSLVVLEMVFFKSSTVPEQEEPINKKV